MGRDLQYCPALAARPNGFTGWIGLESQNLREAKVARIRKSGKASKRLNKGKKLEPTRPLTTVKGTHIKSGTISIVKSGSGGQPF